MIRSRALWAILAWLGVGSAARADFVRATIKIDVRDAAGKPQEAEVTVRPQAGGDAKKVSRVGEVYVSDGVVEGVWTVEVPGAPSQTVRVRGRQTVGAVLVIGDASPSRPRSRHDRHDKTKRAAVAVGFVVGPDEPACDDDKGAVIEAVAFTRAGLGAGRLEVRRGGRLVCVAIVAGGGATLRLAPGDYQIDARFVGGSTARESYRLRSAQFPPPLIFRAR